MSSDDAVAASLASLNQTIRALVKELQEIRKVVEDKWEIPGDQPQA